MKKIFLAVLLFTSFNLFAKDWDEDDEERGHHKKEKYNKDYFSLGLYGGEYQSFSSPFYEPSYVFNAVAIELEYIKNKSFIFL